MFIKNYNYVFLITLIIGTVIAISSNSWFTRWLGLEINLIRIIPLILINLNKNLTEAAIKYFMVQAMASLLLIFSSVIGFMLTKNILIEINELLISSALIIKAGLAPLQFWFPQVVSLLQWSQCFIIFTWQKIAPIYLLNNFSLLILFTVIIFSAIVGILGGLNQVNLKILLTYSSISHSAWILSSLLISIKVWILYFFIYSSLNYSIIKIINENQINKSINEINKWNNETTEKFFLFLRILRLRGLPPLLGFAGKLLVVIMLIQIKFYILILFLISSSLVSTYFYLRIIYSSLIFKRYYIKLVFKNKLFNNKLWNALILIINFLLPIILLFF